MPPEESVVFFHPATSPTCRCSSHHRGHIHGPQLLAHEDIFVGADTFALLLFYLQDEGEDVQGFYNSILRFYKAFVAKQLKTFDFKKKFVL